jgi:hypothetical protein
MAVDKSGRVHAIELASKTDMGKKFSSLQSRNLEVMENLPVQNRGDVVVLKHPYDASTIKRWLDGLIGDI